MLLLLHTPLISNEWFECAYFSIQLKTPLKARELVSRSLYCLLSASITYSTSLGSAIFSLRPSGHVTAISFSTLSARGTLLCAVTM